MPIVSMLEKIKNQLMTKFYTKNQEVEEMGGTVCPKIRKKLVKFEDLSNNYFALPAGKGLFVVGKYQVDILQKQCSCRRWQLTGIPCQHSISCLRHERISPETMVHDCYSINCFKVVYDEVIVPCRYETEWESMNGCLVEPPVYTKTVGRPPTKRRKGPEEKDGKLTRHGTIQHCSVCFSPQHNKRKCPELLGRAKIPLQDVSDEVPEAFSENEDEGSVMGPRRKLPVRRTATQVSVLCHNTFRTCNISPLLKIYYVHATKYCSFALMFC